MRKCTSSTSKFFSFREFYYIRIIDGDVIYMEVCHLNKHGYFIIKIIWKKNYFTNDNSTNNYYDFFSYIIVQPIVEKSVMETYRL